MTLQDILDDIVFQHEKELQRINYKPNTLNISLSVNMDPAQLHIEITERVNTDLASLLENFWPNTETSTSRSQVGTSENVGALDIQRAVIEERGVPEVNQVDYLQNRIASLENDLMTQRIDLERITAQNETLQADLQTERDRNHRIFQDNIRLQEYLTLMTTNMKSYEVITRQHEKLCKFIETFESRIQKDFAKLHIGNNNTEDIKIGNFINSVILDAVKMNQLAHPE
ncbi:hypothetical protein CRE_20873 [Caenorhabditis remanei]|uniref:Uncharacterized protein n=1 Tax=Caenorhabditis remanei TaxID=31234 RepID=E3MV16_CAERE|nr:hypothetical protein CRE_20873 [Caenorhabditis remanei]